MANYIEKLNVTTMGIETVELEKVIHREGRNIFFIESNNDVTSFHPRLLCAFESAALHNPTMKVCISNYILSFDYL